jgi:dTDP-4-dehydrorhamnose reductase
MSTDYVFDGMKGSPYVEDDDPNPLNVYGRSKLEGEEWVRRLLVSFYIVRASWLFGRGSDNFVYKILKKSEFANSSARLAVVDDQLGSPTYTLDLANSIAVLVSTGRYGLYHLANAGYCSWYEFARRVFIHLKKNVSVKPIDSPQLKQPAQRPSFSALESSVWGKAVGEKLRNWDDALRDFLLSHHEGQGPLR